MSILFRSMCTGFVYLSCSVFFFFILFHFNQSSKEFPVSLAQTYLLKVVWKSSSSGLFKDFSAAKLNEPPPSNWTQQAEPNQQVMATTNQTDAPSTCEQLYLSALSCP